MSVYRRRDTGNWFIDFSDRFGRVRKTLDFKKYTKRQAEAVERQIRQQREDGKRQGRKGPVPRWSDLAARYWEEHGQHLSWSPSVKAHLDRLSDAIGDATPVDQITPAFIAGIFGRWRGQVTDTTLNRRLAVLRGAWLRATEVWEWRLQAIPWRRLSYSEPEPTERHLSLEEVRRLMAAAPHHLALAIEMAMLTGLRQGAILSLTWEMVDFDRDEINATGKGRAGGKPNIVPITPAIREFLEHLGPRDVGPLITYRGKAVHDVRNAWSRTRAKAQLPGVRFHDLRHTFAQDLLDEIGDLSIVQDALHHTNPKTTERYAHRNRRQIKEALTRVQASRKFR